MYGNTTPRMNGDVFQSGFTFNDVIDYGDDNDVMMFNTPPPAVRGLLEMISLKIMTIELK